MIVIVDYKMGNLGSILNMLKKIGAPATISSRSEDVAAADRLILPGVGAFDAGMSSLRESGLMEVIHRKAFQDKIPVLGICLGMQMLFARSEEGSLSGLGWIEGEIVRFRFHGDLTAPRIPHMGWNTVAVRREDSLFRGMERNPAFYFVHSYHAVCRREEDVLARAHYGFDFVVAVQRGNIFGTQFHPEKSHRYGLNLLRNFAELS